MDRGMGAVGWCLIVTLHCQGQCLEGRGCGLELGIPQKIWCHTREEMQDFISQGFMFNTGFISFSLVKYSSNLGRQKMGRQGTLVHCSPWGHKESDTVE